MAGERGALGCRRPAIGLVRMLRVRRRDFGGLKGDRGPGLATKDGSVELGEKKMEAAQVLWS